MFAIRQGPWKLILETKGSGGWVEPEDSGLTPGTDGQLYNLANDPYEKKDLWGKHPEIAQRLTELLEKVKREGYNRPLNG